MLKATVFLLLFSFLLSNDVSAVFSQNSSKKKELENKKKKLQEEISYKNKLLKEVKGSKSKSLLQLAIIKNKLRDQEELISTINGEISIINNQISGINKEINERESEIQRLKREYAKLVFVTYKNRSAYDRLVFIFSANDFNQAYQRLKYFQIFAEYRKKQASEIEKKKQELNAVLKGLEQKKDEQKFLLTEKENEKNTIDGEREEKEELISDLQKKEKTINEELREKRKQADKIKKMIDKIIEEEIKKQKELLAKKNKEKNKNNESKSPVISLTPEEELVSRNFEGNQGKLPWPLSQGVITGSFGPHKHPELPNVEINNNGVEIATNKGSVVRAIFEGEVTAVAEVGGVDGKIILIRHGEYLSVYYTLEEVYVKTGDKIKTKQELGKVMTDENGKTRLTLQIYKGKTLLNPESWIANKL